MGYLFLGTRKSSQRNGRGYGRLVLTHCWSTSLNSMPMIMSNSGATRTLKGGVCPRIIGVMQLNSIGDLTGISILCQIGDVIPCWSSDQMAEFGTTTMIHGHLRLAAELWKKRPRKQVFRRQRTSKLVKTTRIRTPTKIVGQWSLKLSNTR